MSVPGGAPLRLAGANHRFEQWEATTSIAMRSTASEAGRAGMPTLLVGVVAYPFPHIPINQSRPTGGSKK